MWESSVSAVRRLMLVAGCVLNIGILGYFKYTGFLLENLNFFFGSTFDSFSVLLPLGISFYTFQQLSFLIDTYRGSNKRYGFVDYSLFVTFFPQLIAGPIVLPEEMLPQFNDTARRGICWSNMNEGLFLFACGLIKKCFLADTLTIVADTGFNSGVPLNFSEGWFVALAYTLQLYFDFSGYCDMAVGIGKFFNIDLPMNFNSPYKSTDFTNFWRRWHITLGRFMMNYLYIPLGGNKKGTLRTLGNLLAVFVLSGLWHGASWLFLLWGGVHGFCILVHRVWSKIVLKKYPVLELPRIPAVILTFIMVNLFLVFL
ncbi:MAG: MBOAT family protein, partial [Lentisphaeria bacterium]|nr:MBOAT family protein [Lentisphaeria bacterium]